MPTCNGDVGINWGMQARHVGDEARHMGDAGIMWGMQANDVVDVGKSYGAGR